MAAFFFVASILQLCYYHWIVYPPIFICYWFKRFKLYCRHQFLSWEWWLVMISTIMLQPMRCPVTQRLFGTAWDAPKERLFRIQRELKQLTRDRRRLDSDSSYFYEYSDLFSAIHDLTLAILAHCIAFAYFVARIILFKFGLLRFRGRMKHPWSKRRKKKKFHVHSTVLNIDKRIQDHPIAFDTDAISVVCDNSANVHVCNDKSMFVSPPRRTTQHYVATIGGKQNAALGMGTVRWSWRDDHGKTHTLDLEDVLYFPQSPVNILSVTSLADQLHDDDGTGIDTKRNKSHFYWDNSKFSRTIVHGTSRLPELSINEGFSLSSLFSSAVGKVVCTQKQHCHCHASSLIPDVDLDTKAAPPLNLSEDMFHVGETLLYSMDGHTTYARIEKIFMDDNAVLRFQVRTTNDELIETTRENLRNPDAPDIGWIPTTIPEKQAATSTLSEEEIASLSEPAKLTPLQEEFVALHERLWHLPYSTMFRLVKLGFLPAKFRKLGNKAPPCVSCLLSQAHRKPWRFKQTKDGATSALRGDKITEPGETVGVDQLISAQPGLVPQDKGIMTRARIWAATVFVDYVTGYIHVGLMTDQSGEATLQCKHDFEHLSATRGVDINHYHADNGRFAEKSFTDDVQSNGQRITYCGVGAHHQNGITENAIKQLTLVSRTLLVHAQSQWPEYITTMLWPFALKAAQDRLNQLNVKLDGRTPDMKYSGVAAASLRLRDFHTFGCPCYILDSRLQTNPKGVPKWEPRARVGIYLGRSPAHASSVALVLNPKTGLVSPQYHVVFDDDFTTVPHLRKGTVPPNWSKLVEGSREKTTSEFFDLTKTWFNPVNDETAGETFESSRQLPNEGDHMPNDVPPNDMSQGSTARNRLNTMARPTNTTPRHSNTTSNTNAGVRSSVDRYIGEGGLNPPFSSSSEGVGSTPVTQASEGDSDENTLFMPEMINLETAGHRRSARLSKQPKKNYTFCSVFSKVCAFGVLLAACLAQPTVALTQAHASVNCAIHHCHAINANFDGSLNEIHHMVLAASKSNNENYTFRQMLQEEDSAEFIKAMVDESKAHETRGHWEVVSRSSVPPETKVIQAIWSFKRKRFPDGTLNKYKARLCAHGGMQQWGVNYWETYAPVVNWISVRFLLILGEIAGLESRAIDFVLAFPQADLDVPVYMEFPLGMEVSGNFPNGRPLLRLKKSLYGLKQASANWHEMLKGGLELRGFEESVADPCVFIKGPVDELDSTATQPTATQAQSSIESSTAQSSANAIASFKHSTSNVIVLVYVDDCIIIAKDKLSIDKFINSLTHGPEQFVFTDEGSLDKYLGVNIERLDDDSGFTLTQPHLISRILEAANIDTRMTNSRPTPAVGPLLSRDEDGPERKHDWKYRTLTGMLEYLQLTSRPEIAFATHQCARFNGNPKLCHEKAVKRICKYLLGTIDKGIIYRPDSSLGLECHVDADFAGGWTTETSANPEVVLSRTGFVISYAGCPIFWRSKLQTEIALSTTEAEYIALSMAMREVLPFLNLMKELEDFLPINKSEPKFFCKVWEDNRSCIKVAESPKFTPRTKHIALKYHHFRRYVSDGTIRIHPIDTLEQNADIFTKPLDGVKFTHLRKKICGW